MPAKPTSGMPGPRSAAPAQPRLRACRTCKTLTATGRLLAGQCPDCAGLIALPLRGEGGRFLPGLSDKPSGGSR